MTAKTPKSKPKNEGMPFRAEIGTQLGSGQDNRVFQLIDAQSRQSVGAVVKINHLVPKKELARHPDPREAAWRGVLYKKNKYELLKLFLGEFVPNTSFVLGNVQEGYNSRPAEYTIQREIPRVSLSDLTPEQKQDPRLSAQVVELMHRMQYMYDVLGETNARTSHNINLDGKLDLGGISDSVKAESLDYTFTPDDAKRIIDENASPNLLVDPEAMRLYCIDFDQGQWTDGMTEAKAMAERIVAHDYLESTHKRLFENSIKAPSPL